MRFLFLVGSSKRMSLLVVLGLRFLIGGCKSDNGVVHDGLLQKRKHRKGFHVDWAKNNQKAATKLGLHKRVERKADQKEGDRAIHRNDTLFAAEEGENGAFLSVLEHLSRSSVVSKGFVQNQKQMRANLQNLLDKSDEEPPDETVKKNRLKLHTFLITGSIALLSMTGLIAIMYFSGAGSLMLFVLLLFGVFLVSLFLFIAHYVEYKRLKEGKPLITEEYRKNLGRISLNLLLFILLLLGFLVLVLVIMLISLIFGPAGLSTILLGIFNASLILGFIALCALIAMFIRFIATAKALQND